MGRIAKAIVVGLVLAGAYAATADAASPSFKCFEIHGSVAPDAGHPTFRINPETRSGLIALREVDDRGREIDPLPDSVRRLFRNNQRAMETTVTGDFVVCPLEPPRPGRLRLAKMASAKNLTVRTDNWLEQNR